MGVVLDAGGLTALARRDRPTVARIVRLQQRGLWPPVVPTAVLVESLTGHGPRDALVNRLLHQAELHALDEGLARRAASLRTKARAGSAVDAVVVATAELLMLPAVTAAVTADIDDLGRLAEAASDITLLQA